MGKEDPRNPDATDAPGDPNDSRDAEDLLAVGALGVLPDDLRGMCGVDYQNASRRVRKKTRRSGGFLPNWYR